MDKDIEQLKNLSDKRNEVHFSYLKQMLVIAGGMFSVLISLHQGGNTGRYSVIMFPLSLLLLSIAFLLMLVALSGEWYNHNRLVEIWKEELLLRSKGLEPNKYLSYNPPKIFLLFEVMGYVFFALSILGLSAYSLLSTLSL